ncbi:hypothetical protein NMG60_11004845 [Bertholletia excelsa]
MDITFIFDEERWVIQIRRTLEEELEEDGDIPVSIFSVPKNLLASDPESFIPQEVAIGPYHHWRPQLYEMERYKVAAAKRAQRRFENIKYHDLVDQLLKLESRIRASYHRYLDFNGETLAWMMAVDVSFLLEFFQVYALRQGNVLARVSSRMSHLVDIEGRKSAHNAILRDIIMLENQIPLFILRETLEFQVSSPELAYEMLLSMLIGLCKELSPFKTPKGLTNLQVSDYTHLLDFLYTTMVPKSEAHSSEIIEIDEQSNEATERKGDSVEKKNYVKQLLSEVWKLLSKLNKAPIRVIKKVLFSRPVKAILKLPWTILSNLPGFKVLKLPPPSVEQITIPSVTEMFKAGIKFMPTKGNISTVGFDPTTASLSLPTITLGVNTETVLRNLVAYETCNGSGPLVFTRYTELMNGIIDTDEDVKLLRESGIILNHLKSDLEAANLWNGMSRPVRLTKVPLLDKVIEDVNKHYNGRWKIKVKKMVKSYVFGSWQFLTLLAATFLLLLMTLQAFCSVYSCSRLFQIKTNE